MRKAHQIWLPILLVCFATVAASAQSFRVQCPTQTITHPTAANNNSEPAYTAPTYPAPSTPPTSPTDYTTGKTGPVNGAIKCQQISGGDGYATMADGTQTYMFSFGPLSGLADIAAGLPGTQFPSVFNALYSGPNQYLQPGDPATTNGATANPYNIGAPGTFTFNGAVGLTNNIPYIATIYDISQVGNTSTVTVVLNTQNPFVVGDQVRICGTGTSTNPCNGPYPPDRFE